MKVIISAGGTGGHIYPALAIINKLKEKDETLDILYIGTHNRMEKDLIPSRGIKYEALEVYGFKKNIPFIIKNTKLLYKAYKRSLKILKEFKPDIVIGVGGYVTFPVIKAAHKLGIKTIIHEQNSIPGKSNKLLSKYASKVLVSLPSTVKYFDSSKVVVTGNPCSENAINTNEIKKETLGFSKDKKLVVIVAGSLGSSTVNEVIIKYLKKVESKDYEVLYISGKNVYEKVKDIKFNGNVKVIEYLDNMAGILKNTDLIITRAGASTISEVIALELPSILIPSPYVADNHQYYNALELQLISAGELIEEKDLNDELLLTKVEEILYNEMKCEVMKVNLRKISNNDSAEKIYKVIEELIS